MGPLDCRLFHVDQHRAGGFAHAKFLVFAIDNEGVFHPSACNVSVLLSVDHHTQSFIGSVQSCCEVFGSLFCFEGRGLCGSGSIDVSQNFRALSSDSNLRARPHLPTPIDHKKFHRARQA